MYLRSVIVLTIGMLLSCSAKHDTAQQKFTQWVNPFIGTAIPDAKTERLGGKGNVYPGAVVPWGMISPSPRNTIEVNSWGQLGASVVGYDPEAKYMYGFDQMHLSGVGCHALGNILIAASPVVSADLQDHKSRYEREVAKPGYYSVYLSDHEITAEMTATTRTSLMRFTSDKPSDSLVITTDMFHNLFPAFDAEVKIVDNHTVEGFNTSGSFCGRDNRETVYFTMEFSHPADSYGTYLDSVVHRHQDFASGPKSGAFMVFGPGRNRSIMLKIGVSYVSIKNARLNLAEEQKGFDFDRIYQNADLQWNKALNRILVEDSSKKRKTIFYTAMYHTLLHPNVFSDVNGEYISMKTKEVMHTEPGQEAQYTIFSLWDTYRNVHSFLSLVFPDKQIDMVRSMVNMAKTSGYLPKWELAANETYVMVGDPATPVIVETYLKGLTNFDIDLAYQYMIKAATDTLNNPVRPGITDYLNLGYIPFDTEAYVWGTMATSLEYNYADYAVAQLAKKLGKPKTYETFLSRSKRYVHFFDPETKFFRPKLKDGSFITPFDPFNQLSNYSEKEKIRNRGAGAPGLVEGNYWQYTLMVNHDIPGLIELMGKDAFIDRLGKAFENDYRFVMTNEPDMAYPFMFNYLKDQEWRTQKLVRETLDKYFSESPGGLPGNDDCGTTSCWSIFASIGLYPVNTLSGQYAISAPVFEKVSIQLDQEYYPGDRFVIHTVKDSDEDIFIANKKLNGQLFEGFFIDHRDIVSGGKLTFNLKPSK